MPTFADLMRTHPEHRGDLWAELDLLYRGGSDLCDAIRADAESKDLSRRGKEILVRRLGEPDALYRERCRRAYALPNLPTIVNFFAAVTLSDPPVAKEAGSEADGWLADFQGNVDRAETDLAEFARCALISALVCRKAVVLVDWPKPVAAATPATRYEEDAARARDGWLCPLAPSQLLDWEEDEEGRLVWAVVLTVRTPRETFDGKRDRVVHEWRVFQRGTPGDARRGIPATPATARLYRAERKKGEGKDSDEVQLVETVKLRTNRVPLVVLDIPHGLWIGGKIGPAERELLNKQNALSWLEYMTAFAFLAEKRISPEPSGESPPPSDGVVKTYRIIPNVGEEGVEWVELSGSSITILSERIFKLTEAIHRSANQLALAAPLGAVDQAASGEAKRRDSRPTAVVAEALAAKVRDFLEEVFLVLAEGRGETAEYEIGGLRRFDEANDLLDMLRSGMDARIPSETARKEIAMRLLDVLLPDLPAEKRAAILAEIESSAPPEDEGAEEGEGGEGPPMRRNGAVPARA